MFKGTGKLYIQFKLDAHPPPRAILEKRNVACKAGLERLCSLGTVKPVQAHADWINSIVPVETPGGSIWLCLDPKDLN